MDEPNENPNVNEHLSLRDYFAGLALQGVMSQSGSLAGINEQVNRDAAATIAYQIADAMLAARGWKK